MVVPGLAPVGDDRPGDPLPARPSARFGLGDRRILTLMLVAGFVQAFAGSLLVVTLPFSRVSLDLTQGQASLVLGLVRVGTFGSLVLAAWGDRIGRRRPFLVAYGLTLVANLATALVPGVVGFTILQAIGRGASTAVASLAIVYLAEELTPTVRSFGIGVYSVAGSLAGGLAFLVAPSFAIEQGTNAWRWPFGLSAIGLVTFPLLLRFLKESRAFRPLQVKPPLLASMRGRLAGRFWRLAAISFLVGAFVAPAVSFAFDHLVNDLDWTERSASLVIITAGAVGASGLFVGGRVADRIGRRPTVTASILVGVAGGLGFYWMNGPILAAWIAIASFGSSAFVPSFAAHRSELFPTGVRAVAGAWLNTAAVLGAIASLAIGYVTIDRFGLDWTVTGLGIAAAAAALLVGPLPETRGVTLGPRPAPARTARPQESPRSVSPT